jgi:hypothetical protein
MKFSILMPVENRGFRRHVPIGANNHLHKANKEFNYYIIIRFPYTVHANC